MSKDPTIKAINKIQIFSKIEGVRQPKNVLKNMKSYDLAKADFSDLNLSGIIFSNENLSEVNFSGTNLENAQFINVKLQKTNFDSANLKNAYFEKSRIKLEQLQQCACLENIDGLSKKIAKELKACGLNVISDNSAFFVKLFGKKSLKWPKDLSVGIGDDPWNNGYVFSSGLEEILEDLQKNPRTTEEMVRFQLDDLKMIKLMDKKDRDDFYERVFEGFGNYYVEMQEVFSGERDVSHISLADSLSTNKRLMHKFKMSVPKSEIPSRVWSMAQKTAFYYLSQSLVEHYIKFEESDERWYMRGGGFYLLRNNLLCIR
ncbi:pentapeptide repeat-containing protein [Candidatus Uabimicrobium amorphum]|uniref:Pentapeptide repeat-containing protein n=1 Tax=Uabimicrobium amorphum TaxID=2596890 RepID=A0A5S9IP48_UABAM|nr:pentapeptide repeat-containing protein [Candidatus Uabimicrobium amorphum]BBM85304.1 hypothetical protein UABAM_03670 [Candidatus Uabimicrobium amorphum]